MKTIKQLMEHNKVLKYKNMIYSNFICESFVSLDESNSDKELRLKVIDMIENDEYESDANAFKTSLDKSTKKEMLTSYSVKELKQMKLFKLKGYNIGFALKKKDGKFQEIVAVHNNEPTIKKIGEDLVKSAIKNGGVYLDHFSGYLDDFYSNLGFVEYDRDLFDPKYDPDGSFRKKYGEADVVYRKLKK